LGIFKCLELVCLVRIKLPNVSGFWRKLSWKNCVFRGLLNKMLQLSGECFCNCFCFQTFLTRERALLKKGKCFPFFIRRKTLSFNKTTLKCWSEFSFLWLFSYIAAKHGKTRKVNSRNSLSCNQTRPKYIGEEKTENM